MSKPSSARSRRLGLLSVIILITAIWLLVPMLTESLGIGTATAQARVTAVESYGDGERSGGKARHTLKFEYDGQQFIQVANLPKRLYPTGTQVQVAFSLKKPHRLVRVNDKWLIPDQLAPGVMLLLSSAIMWGIRNGKQGARLRQP